MKLSSILLLIIFFTGYGYGASITWDKSSLTSGPLQIINVASPTTQSYAIYQIGETIDVEPGTYQISVGGTALYCVPYNPFPITENENLTIQTTCPNNNIKDCEANSMGCSID